MHMYSQEFRSVFSQGDRLCVCMCVYVWVCVHSNTSVLLPSHTERKLSGTLAF